MQRTARGERGAAVLEYVLLLGLIALIGIAGLRSAGTQVGEAFDDAGRALGATAVVVAAPHPPAPLLGRSEPTPRPGSGDRVFPGGGHAGGGKGKK